jgi:hypothetical protein
MHGGGVPRTRRRDRRSVDPWLGASAAPIRGAYWRMREITTHIDIDAGAALVWHILTDVSSYRRWNPLVRSVLGSLRRGSTILITELRSGTPAPRHASTMPTRTVQRTVKHVREARELYWLGGRAPTWAYTTERRFRIEPLDRGGVRFHQSERFSGFLVPFLWGGLRRDRTPAFCAMNEALKLRAERAEAGVAAARAPAAVMH